MLSCSYAQNVIDGKKTIILNPAEQQRRDVPSAPFLEGEIYGMDVLVVSSAEGKVTTFSQTSEITQFVVSRTNTLPTSTILVSFFDWCVLQARSEDSRATIYQRVSDVNYQLKMKTSRAVFSEAQKKSGAFPFNIRCLEDEKKARMGLQEAVQHGLVREYGVLWVIR